MKLKHLFIDSSALFALFYERDQYHKRARAEMKGIRERRLELVTSNLVVAETHQLIILRLNHLKAREWLNGFVENSGNNMIYVDKKLFGQAWDLINHYHDKSFSLTDATSFVIMDQILESRLAFHYDEHFEQYGCEAIKA